MAQTIQIRANVRPQRIAALVGPNATAAELAGFFGLASLVWGGRYWPMIRVADPISPADLRRIAAHGPDILCGLGIDMKAVAPAVANEVGMIPYLPLLEPREVFQSPLRPVSVDAPIERLSREYPVITESRITAWEIPDECPLSLFYAASFGSQSRQTAEMVSQRFKGETRVADPRVSTADFITDSVHMARRVSWLDLGSYGLNPVVRNGDAFFAPHTIVLVGPTLHELASYWMIRSQRDRDSSGFFLPLPIRDVRRRDVLEALVHWAQVLPLHSNFMRIACDAAHVAEARRLATRLRTRLSPRPFEFIDVHLVDELEPTVVSIDGEHQFDAGFESDVLTFDPPQPRSIDPHSRAYMVDLIKDRGTGRSPSELFLPQRRVSVDVLRAQSPPFFSPGLPRIGLTFGHVSIRAADSSACRFEVPTVDELIGEILREGGFTPAKDEKRRRYETVIAMFGGLTQTAEALIGYSGALLEMLTNKGTLTLQEIRGAMAPYAAHRTAGAPRSDWLDEFLAGSSETTQRVTRERFDRHRSRLVRSDDELTDLLGKLSRLRVLLRTCRPDRCDTCLDHSWLEQLDVSRQLICSSCGRERHLPASLPIGYTINPVVKLALEEGIGPVVLTGRLLYHLTGNGFLWAPGVKADSDSGRVDFDVIALCDGLLVTAESKTLRSASPTDAVWKRKVIPQYRATIANSKRIGADISLLSMLTPAYPPVVTRAIQAVRATGIGTHAIAGPALERGFDEIISRSGGKQMMSLHDLLPSAPKARRLRNRPGPRHISVGGVRQEADAS